MDNIGKKLFDVAFQKPAGFGVVLAGLITECPETIDGLVGSLTQTTGEGVGDEDSVEEWVEFPVNRMMKKPVSDRGFVDISGFWVIDIESLI